jgi:hypothetical protein
MMKPSKISTDHKNRTTAASDLQRLSRSNGNVDRTQHQIANDWDRRASFNVPTSLKVTNSDAHHTISYHTKTMPKIKVETRSRL